MEHSESSSDSGVLFQVEEVYNSAWQAVFLRRLYSIYGQVANAEILVQDLAGETYERLLRHFKNNGIKDDLRPQISGGFILRAFETACIDHFRRVNGHYRPRKWLVDLVGKPVAAFLYKHACERRAPDAQICSMFFAKSDSEPSDEIKLTENDILHALSQMRKNDECGRIDCVRTVEGDAPLGRGDQGATTVLDQIQDTAAGPDQLTETAELRELLEVLLIDEGVPENLPARFADGEKLLTSEEKLCLRVRVQAQTELGGDGRLSEAKMAQIAGLAAHTFRRRCDSAMQKIEHWLSQASGT